MFYSKFIYGKSVIQKGLKPIIFHFLEFGLLINKNLIKMLDIQLKNLRRTLSDTSKSMLDNFEGIFNFMVLFFT
jgi:hypothetical protein